MSSLVFFKNVLVSGQPFLVIWLVSGYRHFIITIRATAICLCGVKGPCFDIKTKQQLASFDMKQVGNVVLHNGEVQQLVSL